MKRLPNWKEKRKIYQVDETTYYLSVNEKQKILLNNIYGVDIDEQAVKVTKLSLLLKLMENEGVEYSDYLFKHHDLKLLPDLANNIKCGNFLIGSDFYNDKDLGLFDKEEMRKVNAFDWEKEFPVVFENGGFDCVVGNPPYIRIHNLVEYYPKEVQFIQKKYQSTKYGKVNIYIPFIEKGFQLLCNDGLLGLIVPNKFIQSDYGINIREIITRQKILYKIIDFSASQVFFNATIYTCLLFLKNNKLNTFLVSVNTKELKPEFFLNNLTLKGLKVAEISEKTWDLTTGIEKEIMNKIIEKGTPLSDLTFTMMTGVKTGANDVFIL